MHWTLTLTSLCSKTFFDRAQEYDKFSVFKNLQSTGAFSKTSVFVAENAVYVWTGGANGGKSLRCRKYPDTCGRSLRSIYVCFSVLIDSQFVFVTT